MMLYGSTDMLFPYGSKIDKLGTPMNLLAATDPQVAFLGM
jgi:hypothetical protein